MNLQALAGETSASTDPNFNNSTFEEKFNNGWLKNYYYGVIVFLVCNVSNALFNLKQGFFYMGNPIFKEFEKDDKGNFTGKNINYNTFFYGVSLLALAGVALLFALSLFLQFQAIRLRSLEKQDACIKIATLFILAQACAAGANVFFALVSGPISMFSALSAGLVFLVIGVGFRFMASNVKNIMLGKAEESFKFDKSAFQA
jgi:hypothetical protein